MLLSLHQQLIHLGSAAFALVWIMHLALLMFASIDIDRPHYGLDSVMKCVHRCMWQSH